MSFQLPPQITMRKEAFGNNWMYVFRHQQLGDLGRIIVQGQPNGETKFTSELSGGPDDPMYQRRKAVFEPLSEKVMTFVESKLGKARNAPPRRAGPATRHTVANKIVTCSTCHQPIAFLIFSNEWQNEGDLEDTARVMYYEIQRLNVPTWVIGEISGAGNPMDNTTIIKKVWRQREAMFKTEVWQLNV